jgi:hypothetical protein
MPGSFVDAETVEAIIRALMPYEREIKSEKHRAMARKNRERDVMTVLLTLADCGYKIARA